MSQHRRVRALSVGAFAAATAGALLLSGCSGSGDSSASGGAESFTLSYAVSNSAVETPYKALAEAYMKANPDVTITLNEVPGDSYGQTTTTQLNAGNASDVFQTAPGTGQAYSILPLAEASLLAPLGDSATGVIPTGSESQFEVDDKTYGVALGLTFVGTVLNQTTADGADFTYPTTTDDLLAQCKTVASSGKSVFTLAGSAAPNTGLMAMVISATRVYADDPTWNEERADGTVTFADSDGWKATLQEIVDMHDAGCFQQGVEGAGFDAITSGMLQGTSMAAFIPSGSAADLKQNAADQDFTIQAFPPADGGKAFGLAGADYALSLNAKSADNEAAKKFVEWAATDDGQQVFTDASGAMPTSDLAGTPFEAVGDIVSAGDFVPLPNSSWPNSSVYDALGSGVQGLLTGQKTVDDVLASMDTAWGN